MALLHLSSSRHLMQTAQYLVPEVFTGDQCDPHLLETCDLPDSKLHVLSAIVELQLFHLLRVKEANCQMRLLAMQKQSATQQQQQQQVVNSSCSSSKLTAMDDSLVESWD